MELNKYRRIMDGLKSAKEEYSRIVFPDCTAKYYAVNDAMKELEKQQEFELKVMNEFLSLLDDYADDAFCKESAVEAFRDAFKRCGIRNI